MFGTQGHAVVEVAIVIYFGVHQRHVSTTACQKNIEGMVINVFVAPTRKAICSFLRAASFGIKSSLSSSGLRARSGSFGNKNKKKSSLFQKKKKETNFGPIFGRTQGVSLLVQHQSTLLWRRQFLIERCFQFWFSLTDCTVTSAALYRLLLIAIAIATGRSGGCSISGIIVERP